MSRIPPLRLRDRTVTFDDGRPLLMGIVNANPDSFSDTVRLTTLDLQVAKALQLVEDGADLIDVGGESGVTYTGVTAVEEEAQRVVPLVERLTREGVTVSVDTWKPEVMERALEAGAHLINDVSGLRDERLADLAAQSGAGLCVMHTRTAPKTVGFPTYEDVIGDVATFLTERSELARAHGVTDEQLLLDPGPDFAKSPHETVEVLRAIDRLHALGRPLLLAVSNKYFVGAITGQGPGDRLAGTLGAVAWAARNDAAMLRVHDVRAAKDLLDVLQVLDGERQIPDDFDAEDERLKWLRADGV